MRFPHGQTVTILRDAPKDRFGDPTGDPDATEVDGCVVWPTSSTEQTGLQDTVTSDLTVLMPIGTGVLATDRVVVGATTYDVAGAPEQFVSPFSGLNPGVVVALKRTTG